MELPVSTDQMIEGVLPMVRKIADVCAQRFRCPSLTYDDLVQIGSLVLVERSKSFADGNPAGNTATVVRLRDTSGRSPNRASSAR